MIVMKVFFCIVVPVGLILCFFMLINAKVLPDDFDDSGSWDENSYS